MIWSISLKFSAILFATMFALGVGSIAQSSPGQETTQVNSNVRTVASRTLASGEANPKANLVKVEGVVTEQKKYSFKVKAGDKEYTIKLVNGAPIGLKMNKPWYDWKNDQVVVDAIPLSEDPDAKPTKRVAIKFPAKQLYLISRFSDKQQMKEVMGTNVKRLNFYLVTPKDPGAQLPSDDKLFISGELDAKKTPVRLNINGKSLPVKLGFRFATMNGFSIMELKPQKTQVFLTGVTGEEENEIIASRVLFQPIESK